MCNIRLDFLTKSRALNKISAVPELSKLRMWPRRSTVSVNGSETSESEIIAGHK